MIPMVLMNSSLHGSNEHYVAEECVSTFRLMKLEQRIEELRRELAIAEREQDIEKVSRLSAEQIQLSAQRQGMLQPQSEAASRIQIVNSELKTVSSIEDKDRDDVMERLLELGGDKKYLTFDDLNRELPDNVVSPDDIEDVLQKLEGSNIPVADSDERLLEQAAATVTDEDEEGLDEDIELDLSAGALEKTNDPVRLYLREMGVVPLLTREGEVAIAKRIERGQLKTQKAIARSPIAVREVLKIGEDLENGRINIRDTVTFSEQAELTGDEDKAEEYRTWTIEGIQNINKHCKLGLKELEKLKAEQKLTRGKKSKKLTRLKRRVARVRLEIAQEIGRLNLTERARQRLINSIRAVQKSVREAEREIDSANEKLSKKRIKPEEQKELQTPHPAGAESGCCRSRSTTSSARLRSSDRYSRS